MDSTRKQLSLDGEWALALDPDDQGKAREWMAGNPPPEAMAVTVPSVWDRWAPDHDGPGWYFRTFVAEDAWQGLHATLHFEAADYYAEVWLNGTRLGEHEGSFSAFSFDASAALLPGENRLAVRIVDPFGENGFGLMRPEEIPASKKNTYWSYAGLWGGVWLEGKQPRHIRDVFIVPDVRRKLITVTVETEGDGTVHAHIEGTEHRADGKAGKFVIDFPEGEPWSPESPTLYTLRCDFLQEDGALDSVCVRFGMREFTVKDQRFHLNGRPLFVRGVLLQPDYPRGLAAPDDPALLRAELVRAKEAGFNLVRIHLRPPLRETLDLADELGLLVYAEPAIGWIRRSEAMRERCMQSVRDMVLQHRNHPSLVIWGMLNETGNAGYAPQSGAQTIKTELCQLARELDPTRLVIDDSGGENVTRQPARYMRPFSGELADYDDFHIFQRAPVDHDTELYFRYAGVPERLFFLSEFGFGGPEDLVATLAAYGDAPGRFKDGRFLEAMSDAAQRGFLERGLDRVFGSYADFLKAAQQLQVDAARFQIDAIRANANCAGYCYVQLADAGNEFSAGILDRWRRPKPVHAALPHMQRPTHPIVIAPRTNLVPRESVNITILLANELRLEGRADLSLQVIGPTKQVLWKKRRSVKLPRHGREIWSGEVAASGSTGTHRFLVRVIQGGRVIAQNQTDLHVFDPVSVITKTDVNVIDPNGRWLPRMAPFVDPGNETAPLHLVPPLANSIRGYPTDALARVLAQVEGGAVAVFFSPPEDWNDLVDETNGLPRATAKSAVGGFLPCVHYAKLHPLFDGLPARRLMRQAFRNVVAPKTFTEPSDEDICGTFDTAPIAEGHYMLGETAWWGNDVLVRRYGSGRLVFTHLRILEHLGEDVVADRMFVNLLDHFSRRSVPAEELLPADVAIREWLAKERNEGVRRWMVIGEFPNPSGEGHEKAYPPEESQDFSATYPGWYKAISWKPWYSAAERDHLLDFQDAFAPVYQHYPRFDYGTGYAYAEFTCDKREEATLRLEVVNDVKLWLNGRLVHASRQQTPAQHVATQVAHGLLRQGRNTVLVKCSKTPGPFQFSLFIEDDKERPLSLSWWK